MNLEDVVRDTFSFLVETAVTRVPRDVYEAIVRAAEREEGAARMAMEAIAKAVRVGIREKRSVCQDTGLPMFFLRIGEGFPLKAGLGAIAREVVAEATKRGILRPNAVHPFTNRNTGDNTGRFVPWIDYEVVEGDSLEVTFAVKGGGSEAPSALYMVSPSRGVEGLRRAVLKAVYDAGPRPCPPTIVGVGVGATAEMAMRLAKRALFMRRMGERSDDPRVAELEERLLNEVNRLGIGPMGFGGRTTVLDLRIEYGCRHPATFAVAIIFNCWALRKASATIGSSGSVSYDPNEVWGL